ncbi:hypothetical protein HY627_01945 [Candidatus Uhrbacteria bacterium]|nr:hypothetical protein [Candidatus Uhrbacteria bacterium]
MKRQTHSQNGALYGALVTIFFLLIVAFWIPSLKGSLFGIATTVGTGTHGVAQGVGEQWRDAEQAMKTLLPKPNFGAAATSGASDNLRATLTDTFARALTDKEDNTEPTREVSLIPVPLQPYDVMARKFCTRQGGTYDGPTSARLYGVCSFVNGSQCEAVMFEYGKCHIGQYSKAATGIPQKPDLVMVKDESGRILVQNRGVVASPETTVQSGQTLQRIPPLAPNASTPVVPLAQQGPFILDPSDLIPEIIEENNSL